MLISLSIESSYITESDITAWYAIAFGQNVAHVSLRHCMYFNCMHVQAGSTVTAAVT